MNTYIQHLAKVLEATDSSISFEDHIKKLEEKVKDLENIAFNRGCDKYLPQSVLGYVLNHHMFDLDSHEKLNIIIDAVLEIACPAAKDDERSKDFLKQIKSNIEKRLNEL